MVKKAVFVLIVLVGFLGDAQPALAGCTTALSDCYVAAAKVDSFWYRWASGLDCELDYAECVRIKLAGM